MQRSWKERLQSRKFLLPLANFVFIVLNEVAGTPIDRQAYWAIVAAIVFFITGESYVDGQAIKKEAQEMLNQPKEPK